MNAGFRFSVPILLAAASLCFGCKKGNESASGSGQRAQGSAAAAGAGGAAPAPAGARESPAGKRAPVAAVDFHRLESFLPAVPVYTRGEPQGSMLQMPPSSYSEAHADYSQGERRIKVTIYDYAYIPGLMDPYKVQFSFENDSGYLKSTTWAGFPGWETWEKGPKSAKAVAAINDRFLVFVEGNGQDDASAVRGAMNATDLKAIAALQ